MHTKLADGKYKQTKQEEGVLVRYEKEFQTGEVNYDYKKLLEEYANTSAITHTKKQKKAKGEEEKADKIGGDSVTGKKFKFIVEDGELFIQCIDSFEDVFELKKEAVKGLGLTEFLDPIMFNSHRDIINALFEVYYDVSNEFLAEFYQTSKPSVSVDTAGPSSTSLHEMAKAKLRIKYQLGPEEDGKIDIKEGDASRIIEKSK